MWWMFSDHGAAYRKGVAPMVNLVSCYDVLRWIVSLLSLVVQCTEALSYTASETSEQAKTHREIGWHPNGGFRLN